MWTYTYDADSEQPSTTDPSGAQTQATYNDFGNQATVTDVVRGTGDPLYYTAARHYDGAGNLLRQISPLGVVTSAALHRALADADAVVHVGGLVGEPACAVDERLATELNFASAVLASTAARDLGVAHYVLFSSCSVYGQHEGTVDEDTEPNPLGIYARTKVLAEQHVRQTLAGHADVTVLRLATVHGRSPRQRLDSVVNRMTAQAIATSRIPLNGGAQRRPLVHVTDVAEVLSAALAHPDGHRVFNVGADRENHTIAEIAATVAQTVPGARIDRGPERDEADARDYRTSFRRLANMLPGTCPTRLIDGVRQIAEAMTDREITDPDLPEYDILCGLLASRTTGHLQPLRSSECDRLFDEYTRAYGGALR